MKTLSLVLALAVQFLFAPLSAQVSRLSVESIFGMELFASDLVPVQWSTDPRYFTSTEESADGIVDLYRVDTRSGERELMLRGADLVPPGQEQAIEIESYEFSADGSKLLIFTNSVQVWRQNTKGEFYVWDFGRRRLTPVSTQPGLQQFAKFSQNGRLVGFVRDNNLFVTDLRSGRETKMTSDGDENIINGATDWVYEEELGLRDAFRFSLDGRRIAFWRFDQTVIKPFYMTDALSLYPELLPVRYPKAGEANSEVRIGVVEISSGNTTWVDIGPETDTYIARMDFANSSDEIWFTRLNRHQNQLDLLLADVRTGDSHVIFTDNDDAWVANTAPRWIKGGRQFLFESERSGYNQVYLYDRDGSMVDLVTPGEWDVLEVYGVDEENEILYYAGAGDGPTKRPLYRVDLDGRNFARLSSGSGSHETLFNADFSLYVDTYSTAGVPSTQTLHSADGQVIRTIFDNRRLAERVQSLNLPVPEFITVPGADGTQLNAYIIRPADFNPGRQYPLLMYVYGGPGSQTVRDSWGGDRYLWHQLLASEGYLVASVDNRGTGSRGSDFKKMTYRRLGELEAADQIAAARSFGAQPFIDADRIGIWGWSYGGYMSLMSMFLGGGVFKAAISGAPVTDWRLYDTIYTERYMRTPQENARGYNDGAPLNHVDKLVGNLLVVHGTSDDNVHFQNTVQLVNALELAGKQFDMRIYPGQRHGFRDTAIRVNQYELFTEWLKRKL
jgi:dipeptidyl-peptidase-4